MGNVGYQIRVLSSRRGFETSLRSVKFGLAYYGVMHAILIAGGVPCDSMSLRFSKLACYLSVGDCQAFHGYTEVYLLIHMCNRTYGAFELFQRKFPASLGGNKKCIV